LTSRDLSAPIVTLPDHTSCLWRQVLAPVATAVPASMADLVWSTQVCRLQYCCTLSLLLLAMRMMPFPLLFVFAAE